MMNRSGHSEEAQASALRQRASRLALERQRLENILMGRGPMLRGSLLERPRICGKKGCKCARGEPHPVGLYLSRTEPGMTARHQFIRCADHQRARKEALSYKEFRQSLRRWRVVDKELDQIWEALGEAREEGYPFG